MVAVLHFKPSCPAHAIAVLRHVFRAFISLLRAPLGALPSFHLLQPGPMPGCLLYAATKVSSMRRKTGTEQTHARSSGQVRTRGGHQGGHAARRRAYQEVNKEQHT